KTFWDCYTVRNHVLTKLEMADDEVNPEIRRRLLTFVVAGGNYAGVETIAELTEFLEKTIKNDYPQIDINELRTVLVHSRDHILPELKQHYPKLSQYAQEYLEQRPRLDLILNSRMQSASPNEVILDTGEVIPTNTIISCTGTAQWPLLAQLEHAERTKSGRLICNEFGQVNGYRNIWSAGDCAAIPHPKGGDSPALAIYAMTAGTLIGKNLIRTAKRDPLKPYTFTGLGDACVLGTFQAVGHVWGIQFRGFSAWLAWRGFMIFYLPTWDRRFRTIADWIVGPLVGRDIVAVRPMIPPSTSTQMFENGQVIMKQGRPAMSMFAVRDGEVELVDETSGEVTRILRRGDHFGATELLADDFYSQTAKAKGPVEILKIPEQQARHLSSTLPVFAQSIRGDGPPVESEYSQLPKVEEPESVSIPAVPLAMTSAPPVSVSEPVPENIVERVEPKSRPKAVVESSGLKPAALVSSPKPKAKPKRQPEKKEPQIFGMNLRMVVIVGILTHLGLTSFYFMTQNVADTSITLSRLSDIFALSSWQMGRYLLAFLSFFANLYIIYMHSTHPPHPKFLLLKKRKVSIRLHVISGSIEFFAAVAAFFMPDPTIPAIIMALAAVVHISTSFFQTPIVFGAKAVMIPSYLGATTLHLFCAFNLLVNPSSSEWLLNTYLALNIYAWVRIYYFVFEKFGLFENHIYSFSVLAAGFTVIPAILGPAGNLVVVGYVLLYILLYKALYPADAIGYNLQENARLSLIDEEARELWETETLGEQAEKTFESRVSRDLAERVYEALDKDESGCLGKGEVRKMLLSWKTPESFIDAVMAKIAGEDKALTFDEFYHSVWSIGRVRDRLMTSTDVDSDFIPTNDPDQQAKFIFDYLDLDQNGYLDLFELEMLLLEWGLPDSEIRDYLKMFDDNHDDRISPQEFRIHFRPVWQFGYDQVLQLNQ
ncbi:MAG: cyclic nucleotide-binding domain-containing protein, partial [Anaerolineae bacterium]